MAAQRGFQATPQGGAVNRGDQRLVAVFIGIDHRRQRRLLHRLAEFADIGAGNKRAPFAHQQQYLGVCVLLALLQGFQQPGTNSMAEGIDRRIVHGNNADTAFPVIAYDLRHNLSSP